MGQAKKVDDAIKPSWVKRRESAALLIEAKEKARTEREKAALERIEIEGLDFWRQLVIELRVNVSGDALAGLDAYGIVDSSFNESTHEKICRVGVVKKGPIVGMTYIGLFFERGDNKIRSLSKEGVAVNYNFCIVPKSADLRVMPSDGTNPMNARQMAERIAEGLFDRASEAN